MIRKNQGRESGASQPHPHQQIIGSPAPLPAIEAEALAEARNPRLRTELIELVDRLGLTIERVDGCRQLSSPIGAFPRSYDVVMPEYRGLLTDHWAPKNSRSFARAIYRILQILGPLPLDYEIHQGGGIATTRAYQRALVSVLERRGHAEFAEHAAAERRRTAQGPRSRQLGKRGSLAQNCARLPPLAPSRMRFAHGTNRCGPDSRAAR